MPNPNEMPEENRDSNPPKKREILPLTKAELERLFKEANNPIRVIDENQRRALINRISEASDLDWEHLRHLGIAQVEFIMSRLGLKERPTEEERFPDFNTRLANTHIIKDILDKMVQGDI
jgi:hypothetical protein